jgi:hypothetical protein
MGSLGAGGLVERLLLLQAVSARALAIDARGLHAANSTHRFAPKIMSRKSHHARSYTQHRPCGNKTEQNPRAVGKSNARFAYTHVLRDTILFPFSTFNRPKRQDIRRSKSRRRRARD